MYNKTLYAPRSRYERFQLVRSLHSSKNIHVSPLVHKVLFLPFVHSNVMFIYIILKLLPISFKWVPTRQFFILFTLFTYFSFHKITFHEKCPSLFLILRLSFHEWKLFTSTSSEITSHTASFKSAYGTKTKTKEKHGTIFIKNKNTGHH